MMESTQRWFWGFITGLIFLFFICPGRADDRARDRATLRGIQAVVVKVHTLEPEWRSVLEKAGLSESVLQASIEQQLERNGIQVLAEEAAGKTESEGTLNVRIKFVDPEPAKKEFTTLEGEKFEKLDTKKRYVYAIRLNFRQPVALLRDPAVKSAAITWQTESVGIRRLLLIREDLKTLVDVFIEAYLSENPGRKTKG